MKPAEERMQRSCLTALADLTSVTSRKLQEGDIRVILQSMMARYHTPLSAISYDSPSTTTVSAWQAEAGCRVLRNLARNDKNKAAIRRTGGVEDVVEAMRQHQGNAAVQEQGCWALRNLARKNEANRVAIGEVGGIRALVEAMQGHLGQASVQEAGCRALLLIGWSDPGRQIKIKTWGAKKATVATAGGRTSITSAARGVGAKK